MKGHALKTNHFKNRLPLMQNLPEGNKTLGRLRQGSTKVTNSRVIQRDAKETTLSSRDGAVHKTGFRRTRQCVCMLINQVARSDLKKTMWSSPRADSLTEEMMKFKRKCEYISGFVLGLNKSKLTKHEAGFKCSFSEHHMTNLTTV